LQNLVRLARRRLLGNELMAQGANSASAALAAFILLLLLGSEILNWRIVVAVPLAAFGAGVYLVRRRLPSRYVTAQIIDHRLGLCDTISTAVFFSELNPRAEVSVDMRDAQIEQAERTSESANPKQAVPYLMPHGAYVTLALLLVASSLFALRYGISKQLDLRRPLANFLPDLGTGNKPVRQASNAKKTPKQIPQVPDENGMPSDDDDKAPGSEDAAQQVQTPSDSESPVTAKGDTKALSGKKQEQGDDQMATDDEESGDSNAGKNGDDGQSGQQSDNKNKQGNQQQGKGQDQNANNESSLMSKMKDAFQNLLSRVKPQQNQQGNQQGSQEQQSTPGKSQQGSKQQNNKEGTPQQGQQGDAQEGEDGQEAKNAENSQQGKGQGKSDSKQSSKQPGSGIGSQDGDKNIREPDGRSDGGGAVHQPAVANAVCKQGRAARAGRRRNSPRRSAGGAATDGAAVLRRDSKTSAPGDQEIAATAAGLRVTSVKCVLAGTPAYRFLHLRREQFGYPHNRDAKSSTYSSPRRASLRRGHTAG